MEIKTTKILNTPKRKMNNLYDFKVICDETNNSKEDIENNILKIDVYVYIKLPPYRINFRVDKEGNVTYTDNNYRK